MIQGTNKTTQMSVVGALLEAERANREKCLKKHNTWPLLWSDDQHRTASLIMVVNCAIGKMMKSFFFSLFFFFGLLTLPPSSAVRDRHAFISLIKSGGKF